MRVHVVLEVRAAEHQLLALVVKCQLAHVDQTRARQVGPNAAPEASNATLLEILTEEQLIFTQLELTRLADEEGGRNWW